MGRRDPCNQDNPCRTPAVTMFPESVDEKEAVKNEKEVSGRAFLLPDSFLPALFDPGHDRVEILVKPLFALFRIISAPVGIALDEPDCIGRSEVFHQHAEPLDPYLIQCLRFHPSSPPSAIARDYGLW